MCSSWLHSLGKSPCTSIVNTSVFSSSQAPSLHTFWVVLKEWDLGQFLSASLFHQYWLHKGSKWGSLSIHSSCALPPSVCLRKLQLWLPSPPSSLFFKTLQKATLDICHFSYNLGLICLFLLLYLIDSRPHLPNNLEQDLQQVVSLSSAEWAASTQILSWIHLWKVIWAS